MKKVMRRILLAVFALSLLFCAPLTAHAAKNVKMPTIKVCQDYAQAQQILKYVNKERKKRHLKALKMDKKLTKHAITRAAELFVMIPFTSPHMRPNGKKNSGNGIIYENCFEVTGGVYSAKEVVKGWMDSPPHKKGILLPEANSIGIAAVRTRGLHDDLRQHCVLEFGSSKAKSVEKSKKRKYYSITVSAPKKYRKKKYFQASVSYLKFDADNYDDEIFRAVVRYKSPDCYHDTVLDGKAFTWKSSNPSIAKIAKDGTVTWKKNGVVKFTAVMKLDKKIKLSVKYDYRGFPEEEEPEPEDEETNEEPNENELTEDEYY